MDRFNPMAGNPLQTRSDVVAALSALVAPLQASYSPGCARVTTGAAGAIFDQSAAEFEGFARPLWGVAAAAMGGDEVGDWSMILTGLANGVDPDHPEYWGEPTAIDQRQVECAALGFALAAARDRIVPALHERDRANVVEFLTAARQRGVSDNNWHGFKAMMDAGLAALGHDPGLDRSEEPFVAMDRFALDDGWYRDGATKQIDHYVGFGFHFYALVHQVFGRAVPSRAALTNDRAVRFAREYAHWFADDGAAQPFGRSLTYRFGVAAFWGALAVADVEALPWGVLKGLYLRQLRWWTARPMTSQDGLLSIGYAYPNGFVAEDYNSPMSPYWALKAFLPLALPDTHPFWAAEETPLERSDTPVSLSAPGMLVRHGGGDTVALTSGPSNMRIRNGAEKYAKFAYSTRFGFSVEIDRALVDRVALDNALGLIDADGVLRTRTDVTEARIGDSMLWSRWSPWPDVVVESWLWWDGPWQRRVHHIRSARALTTIEGASAIALPNWPEQVAVTVSGGRCRANTARDFVAIVDLAVEAGGAEFHRSEPNSNLLAPRTGIPRLRRAVSIGESWLDTAILSGDPSLVSVDTPLPARADCDALQSMVETLRPVGIVEPV